MTKAELKGVAALVFAMSPVLTAWDSQVGKHVELEGRLYLAGDSSGTPGGLLAAL